MAFLILRNSKVGGLNWHDYYFIFKKNMEHNFHDEANNVQNLGGKEAIAKLKELAEAARICMFTTYTSQAPMPSRPMALQAVDEKGKMYFFSANDSDKNKEIIVNPQVQLFFANTGSSEYLNVFGAVEISNDRAKIKELWSMWAKAWFQDGPEDEKLSLLIVTPKKCEYWDTKHNKMVQLLKIAASIVIGKTMDDSIEGELNI